MSGTGNSVGLGWGSGICIFNSRTVHIIVTHGSPVNIARTVANCCVKVLKPHLRENVT